MQYETWWHAAKHIRTVKSEFDILQFIQNNEFRLFFAWIRVPRGPVLMIMAKPSLKWIPNYTKFGMKHLHTLINSLEC